MNLFQSLEEHAELFLEVIQERAQNQISSFGGVEQRLQDIVATLRAHIAQVKEVVETPQAAE